MPADLLTVVVMNWARPANVEKFVGQHLAHPRVGEVIVWDSSPRALYPAPRLPDDARVRHVCSSADLGLYPRFAMGSLARFPAVLVVDDDIELPAATVTRLHDEWLRDGDLVHGVFGRRPTPDGSYTPGTFHGPVEVVLTRVLVAGRFQCGLAAAHGTRVIDELPGQPRGNGEDILLSYAAMARSGRLNRAYDLPYRNDRFDAAEAISVRWPGHGAHRTRVVRWCRRNLLGGPVPAA